jgi:predicted SprT family Zn-dependent metalloprotease
MDLHLFFDEINAAHFDGFLDLPTLKWNSRLRASAGRFIPGQRKPRRKSWFAPLFEEPELRPPVIEIASYLKTETNGEALVRDTLGHEMIHYWLWMRRRPYGHTDEFYAKMRAMGVSRYNTVPRTRPFKYIYRCGSCEREFPARRKLGVLACSKCCEAHSGGRFDARFKLELARAVTSDVQSP